MNYLSVNEIIVKVSENLQFMEDSIVKEFKKAMDKDPDLSGTNLFDMLNGLITEDTMKLDYEMLPHLANLSFDEYKRVQTAIKNKVVQVMINVQNKILGE